MNVAWWRRPVWMTRQSWASVASAIAFLCCVALLTFVPVPYVTWAPGETQNVLGTDATGAPLVQVDGVATHPTTGELDLTTVSVSRVEAHTGLVEVLVAWARPGFDVLDRELYYPPGTTAGQEEQERAEMMSSSQLVATAAAARAAGLEVTERPVVGSVIIGGPADQKLRPGDVVLQVEGHPVTTAEDVAAAIDDATAGRDTEPVQWRVRRDGQEVRVATGLRAGADPAERAGVEIIDGWDTPVRARFAIPDDIGGSSAGLVFSLALYDLITPGDLVAGRHLAGTGTITADGRVGPIGGIQSKIAGAEAAGATVFLVPADNCVDLAGVRTDLQLVRVATLDEAIEALRRLRDDPGAEVPTC